MQRVSMSVGDQREEKLNELKPKGNVLYIMARDQRINHNYCVSRGFEISEKLMTEFFLGLQLSSIKANERQKTFMIEGLKKLEKEANKYNVSMFLINDLEKFVSDYNIGVIIIDFNPMREYRKRDNEILKMCEVLKLLLLRIDTHNLVPARKLNVYKKTSYSVKLQLKYHFEEYFEKMPEISKHKYNIKRTVKNKYPEIHDKCHRIDGGFDTGMQMFEIFCEKKFDKYCDLRNMPDFEIASDLSPWLHFGQISPQQIIYLTIKRYGDSHQKENRSKETRLRDAKNLESFLNEIFVWRETAEHFVYHEANYDSIDGALHWAKETLLVHKADKRPMRYSSEELEFGKTRDSLWNACQRQLLCEGKIHGYCRIYWCKTLLKWFNEPKEALDMAIRLNDKYEMDGNDPNGYAGCMWSICGTMDRGFKERPILGKIRAMNPIKCYKYIEKYQNIEL